MYSCIYISVTLCVVRHKVFFMRVDLCNTSKGENTYYLITFNTCFNCKKKSIACWNCLKLTYICVNARLLLTKKKKRREWSPVDDGYFLSCIIIYLTLNRYLSFKTVSINHPFFASQIISIRIFCFSSKTLLIHRINIIVYGRN